MSALAQKLNDKQFVVTTELTPPKGTDLAPLLEKAQVLANLVDAFNLTDSASSKMSLSPIAAGHALLDLGIAPILQMTTRDRNRIALQGDMLGAWHLGIENLVCMGGDPPHLGDHPEAKPVYDISTEDLIRAAGNLNKGRDLTDNPLNAPTDFNIGAVVNPGADDLDKEIARLEQKVEAGATFYQTQAIYDAGKFDLFMERITHLNIHILAGILPIKSVKMANFMNDKVPGIDIPDHLIQRIDEAGDVACESASIAAATIRDIRSHCAGIHLMALGWEEQIPTILERAEIER